MIRKHLWHAAVLLLLLLVLLTACTPPDRGDTETSAVTLSGETTSAPGSADSPDDMEIKVTLTKSATTLENFPVLIRFSTVEALYLAKAEVFTVTDESGMPLAYEAVKSQRNSFPVDYWVLLPVYSAETATTLTFRAGGSGSAGTVFGDYELVLHMDSYGGGDSSPNDHTVTAHGGVKPTDPKAGSGGALLFDGDGDYLTVDGLSAPIVETPPKPINNAYTNVGYQKPTSWNHAQGLTTDGEYLYFAGHHDQAGLGASIHKIRLYDLSEIAVFDNVAPMHGADMDYHGERGTLFVSSGGNHPTKIYELDKETGERLAAWDLRTVGYGVGAAITLIGGTDVILTTGGDGAEIAFAHVTLLEDGDFTVHREWYHDAFYLGVPQGIESLSRTGDDVLTVYYLADAGASVSVDPHYLYKIDLARDGSVTVSERYHISIGEETEGISFYTDADGKTTVLFGSNAERIYRFDAPLEELIPTPFDAWQSANSFTLSCVVRVDGLPNTYPGILGFGSLTNNKNRFSLHLFGDTEGKLRFGTCLDDVWTKLDTDAGALETGEFHHIAAVYDGLQMALYVDGELYGTKTVSGLITDYGAPFSVGADVENGSPTFFFAGAIDEVRLYYGIRSPEWIAAEADLFT